MAQLLLNDSCTVTIAHSKTKDLPGVCRQADIVVAAVGRPEMVKGDWIKKGATVIDVGINRIEVDGPEGKKGKLVGDVDFDGAKDRALAITPEELLQVRDARFFEVFNGHPTVYNNGTNRSPSMDRLWDIALTRRLAELKFPVMYGLGTDDGHNYHTNRVGSSNPFRGWVWVRSAKLTPEGLIAAMEAGDFYSSSGVKLRELKQDAKGISLEIEAEPGVTYTTQFIGTRRGYDPKHEPQRNTAGVALRVAHTYSKDVGAVLAEAKGPKASYALKGDEIYVRAKVISSKLHPNPSQKGDVETAWTQPVIGAAGR